MYTATNLVYNEATSIIEMRMPGMALDFRCIILVCGMLNKIFT